MNKPHTQATKEKIRLAHLGKKLSKKHRAKVIKTLCNEAGAKNPNWKGGRTLQGKYVLVRMPSHPQSRSNGYYPEHRLVMEKVIGRYLGKEEVVHHINGNKEDNRPENLVITTHHLHGKEHWKDEKKRKDRSDMMKQKRRERFWSTKPKKTQPWL